MADDSDGEYAEALSEDDFADHQVTSGHGGAHGRSGATGQHQHQTANARASTALGTRSQQQRSRGRKNNHGRRAAWEEGKFTWDVPEDAEGNVSLTALLEAEKRRRLLRDTTPLQRGIIRHMVLVLDMSFAMLEKDLLPSRYILMMHYAVDFVREYFEQNPISQLGIIAMRDGVAVHISEMSGNPADHIDWLRSWEKKFEPRGNPSLQNALEMCRGDLFHAPSHGTREVLIIYGALLSSDPGDIHDTIASLIADRIRVSIVGLSAQVAICAELCAKTNGGDDSCYSVAMHEQHFRELFLTSTTPPVTRQTEQNNASLLMMGFPSRSKAEWAVPGDSAGANKDVGAGGGSTRDAISMCACHNKPCREGYLCTRCSTKVCRLPAECPACGLTLILSTHLARSYHHLFPLRNWVEVPWSEAGKSVACYACLAPFPDASRSKGKGKETAGEKTAGEKVKGISESGRYACEVCGNHFCIDCDVFAHEVLHNCAGCQSDTRIAAQTEVVHPAVENGVTHANGEMIVDS
ncbi:TFIIH basal transcription factor complex p47 subunit [Cytospora mali]|uniref:General transcription and DNA repair factor IIH n=1 Tax=Cytospora mali TaxID=578113 RepID=A0A194VSV2_CYTMA|nr:TFIIH basal transcription factor complex p47 subunit [Valsa mali]